MGRGCLSLLDCAAALLLTLEHSAVLEAKLPLSSPSAQSYGWAERPGRLWIAVPAQRAAAAAAAMAGKEEGEGWVVKAAEA